MSKRLRTFVPLIIGSFLLLAFQTIAQQPNIVFIVADDLGYGDLSCYGNPFNETPNIDSLARRGIKYINAYSSSPVCSPSRAGILTGRHPARLHLTNFLGGEKTDADSPLLPAQWTRYLSPKEITLAELLKQSGYQCGMVGKWHLGSADSLLPSAQGFDYERMIARNGLDYYNYTITSRNKTVFEDNGTAYLTDKLTEFGVDFIEQRKDKPFFLFMAYSAPHVLLVPRADKLRKYFFKYAKVDGAYNPNYAAMIESLDDGVGELVASLRRAGIENNTIIIFTSDNGGVGLDELGPTPTSMKPLRAWKGHVYEGGIRVPLIIQWSGTIESNRVSEQPTMNTDFFPTLAGLLKRDNGLVHLDGHSILSNLQNPAVVNKGNDMFWHYPHFSNQLGRPAGAIRSGDFKLIEKYESNTFELYDLKNDEGENNDISRQNPELVREMKAKLKNWQKQLQVNMPLAKKR